MTPRPPSFAIVLTTYMRPQPVLRAIESVLKQSYPLWRLVLVNDSPAEDYTQAEELIGDDGRISYIKNETNTGKNASVNRAFDLLRNTGFQGHVVFLDDDDWLAPDCLATFADSIEKDGGAWLVSARASTDGIPFTKNRTGHDVIRYYRDCLLFKRFSGDATHCIGFKKAVACQFLTTVKNAEEWFFFAQIARHSPTFRYLDSIGTFSEGYLDGGLTRTNLTLEQKLELYRRISREMTRERLWSIPTSLYMVLRLGRIFV
jgi:glycosyltransferase involved in cell wall biosynthesis